jgi:hypothetical protein
MAFTQSAGFAGFDGFGARFRGFQGRRAYDRRARDRGGKSYGGEAFARARAYGAKYDASSRRAALDRLDRLATWFDTAFLVPGTSIRFGFESLLRLIPGVGDAAASLLSCYLLIEAYKLNVPPLIFARMVANVLVEGTVGAVPLAGDAFDVMFRANRRNIALLREHFARVGY